MVLLPWGSTAATSVNSTERGHFEVIAGKSILAFKREEEGKQELSARCFAWVQSYDEKPKRRLFERLQAP